MRFTILLMMTVSLFVVSSSAQIPDLEGEWVAVSPRTRGITRVVIMTENDGYFVEAWGRCHPQDCVWGRSVFTPVATSVDDTSFKGGFANWEPGFASKYLLFSLDRRMLRVETVTVFRDRSKRSSFRIVEYLRRVEDEIP